MLTSGTVVSVVNKYLQKKSIDRCDGTTKLRSNCSEDEVAKMPEKSVVKNNVSSKITNPFLSLTNKNLTEVQCLTRKFCMEKHFEKYGSLALSASCGSGKTLCGLYLMYKFQCKTLIFSTRNAVKDQWFNSIRKLYPKLKVYINNTSKKPNDDYDVWIFSPQYLNFNDKINSDDYLIHPSLIIYDEVHTMLSAESKEHQYEFANVLKYPFIKCLDGSWSELPYLFAISATYPKFSKPVEKIFGSVHSVEHNAITDVQISVWDYRRTKTLKERGKFDSKYRPLNEVDFLKFIFANTTFYRASEELNSSTGVLGRREITPKFKGVFMFYTIDHSAWAAYYIQQNLNCNVLLIRAADEASFYLPVDSTRDHLLSETATLSDVSSLPGVLNIGKDFKPYLKETEVIVSTLLRMKEGFSVEELTWGVCASFPYSELARVQILGRIRRTSENTEIQKQKRVMFVCSGKVPNDAFKRGRWNSSGAKELYDWEFEKEMFEKENIAYLN